MPTGRTNKTTSKSGASRATSLRFEGERMIMRLRDERELSVPLALYPTLRKARPQARAGWELLGGGRAVRWEALDLDLSVEGILQGLPGRIPRPPATTVSRRTESGRKRRAG
jgi:hypothetical protein